MAEDGLGERLARWRVPLGWALGLLALGLARPSERSLALGLPWIVLGEALRIWAAGHLDKTAGLTTSGPYGWTRNPLYLGSFLLGAGFALVAARWEIALGLVVLLGGVYGPVLRAEARHLEAKHGEAYRAWARRVPLLVPRRIGRGTAGRRFSWRRVFVNGEHRTVAGVVAATLWLVWRAKGGP